jgi:hypothetical protein
MRAVLVAIAIAALAHAASATPPQNGANEQAYTMMLICVIVSENDADGQRAMAALRQMQRVQGYDNHRLAADMSKMASALGVQKRNDPTALGRHRAACRKLGLIS